MAAIVAGAAMYATAPSVADTPGAAGLHEVGRLELTAGAVEARRTVGMGWLILNPISRRGYQVFETSFSTTLQSFDLDTLALRRRVTFSDVPVLAGTSASGANSPASGEVVHAVDQKRGRIYLAMSRATNSRSTTGGPDTARAFGRVLAIDEAAFDRGDPAYAATFREPVTQVALHEYTVKGMTVDESSPNGSLVLLLADAQKQYTETGVYAHAVASWTWDPKAIPLNALAPNSGDVQAPPVASAWAQPGAVPGARVLESCSSNPITYGANRLQWAMAVGREAIHLVCRQSSGTSQVVRLPLAGTAREPVAEEAPPRHRLGKGVSEVLVDPSSGRLFLRDDTGGVTWWTFDTKVGRFMGSFAAMAGSYSETYGIDTTRGRIYALIPDHVYNKGTGIDATGKTPVRGGLQLLDGYLDPLPALENVDPSRAYPGIFRIQVDPVRRRVFVRFGALTATTRAVYPSPDYNTPAPVEPFYRVFQDDVPHSVPVPPQGDELFTTNVEEAPGATQASFLGEGLGYGTRVRLTGGLAAATTVSLEGDSGLAGDRSPVRACATVDRELVLAEATSASVSDVSTSAGAAALDADAATKTELAQPLSRCLQAAWPGPDPAAYKFDNDGNEIDDYVAECVENQDNSNEEHARKRGFAARATCRDSDDKANVATTGALGIAAVPGTPEAPIQVGVGSSSSTVNVERPEAGGVEVVVKSTARNIEVPVPGGGSIRVASVDAEARSWARGKKGKAGTSFGRVICGIDFGDGRPSHCLRTAEEQQQFVDRANAALNGNGEVRLRAYDATLAKGTPFGYRSGIVRDPVERFTDQVINRDDSLAVPGLEVIFYRGDSRQRGAGRQIFQFAGVQATSTYGIACINGQGADGKCSPPFGENDFGGLDFSMTGEGGGSGELFDGTVGESVDFALETGVIGSPTATLTELLGRVLRAPLAFARFLLASPREFALMLAVWALIYWPCYLGERRRKLRRLANRRAVAGMAR